jgi:hypothetical protein
VDKINNWQYKINVVGGFVVMVPENCASFRPLVGNRLAYWVNFRLKWTT